MSGERRGGDEHDHHWRFPPFQFLQKCIHCAFSSRLRLGLWGWRPLLREKDPVRTIKPNINAKDLRPTSSSCCCFDELEGSPHARREGSYCFGGAPESLPPLTNPFAPDLVFESNSSRNSLYTFAASSSSSRFFSSAASLSFSLLDFLMVPWEYCANFWSSNGFV